MTPATWVVVGLLGGLAGVGRFLLDGLVGELAPDGFPWGTFAVNASGAFLLGLVVGAGVHGNALVLAGTATLGSYTTMSTLMFETHRLAQDDQLALAGANVLVSLLFGFGALVLGHAIGSIV
jgi:CrcB protein